MSAFESTEHYTGLVRDIRVAIESEQFDLGGYTEARARDLIVQAFTKPLTAPLEMVKFTFVIGGGKLVRSRYPDELGKWMVAALREIGFSEDHSAAETFDSQATYKHQHDTGQNLKYLIVYPRVACSSAKPAEAQAAVLDATSPAYLITASKLDTFKALVADKIMSYTQKKAALKILEDNAAAFKDAEAKLVSGAQLSEAEQQLYDNNPGCDEEKITWLQGAIKEMVDAGQLTAKEKAALLVHIDHNLEATEQELQAARAEGKPKKAEKLEAKKAAATARRVHVAAVTPVLPRLRHGEQIGKHHQRLFPMYAIEEKGRSMSMTLQDLKAIEDKPDLEQAVDALCQASKGWFADEDDFALMCQQEEKLARVAYKAQMAKASAGKPKASGSASASSWSTVGRKAPGAPGKATVAKKTASGFAAAFADDSEDD